MFRIFLGAALFSVAQVLAWFQSNSGILGGKLAENFIWIALVFGPIVSVLFAYGTKIMYAEIDSLWAISFLTFGIGYLVFIPLTWYFLGEEILTLKNILSFCLCLTLITIQFIMK